MVLKLMEEMASPVRFHYNFLGGKEDNDIGEGPSWEQVH
jgi:hypothetical protein